MPRFHSWLRLFLIGWDSCGRLILDWLDGPKIGPQRFKVAVGDFLKRVPRHLGIEHSSVRGDTCFHGSNEIYFSPFADAGFGIGRDVTGINLLPARRRPARVCRWTGGRRGIGRTGIVPILI